LTKIKILIIIDLFDFKISNEPLINTVIILFIDTNGETKIIKNRYGDRGICDTINKFKYE
jgi:hypothetical protein